MSKSKPAFGFPTPGVGIKRPAIRHFPGYPEKEINPKPPATTAPATR